MRFMKKLLALILVLVLCLCSCTGEKFTPERGTLDARTYENKAFGVGYTALPGMEYYSDPEIAAIMGISESEMLTEPEDLADAYGIYDMYCIDELNGNNISVNFESSNVSPEEYLMVTEVQVANDLVASNLVVKESEITEITLGGETIDCLKITIDAFGMNVYEIVAVKPVENWMMIITASSLTETECESVIEGIYFM